MSKEVVMTDEEIERELSWLKLKYPNVCFRDGDFYNGDKIVWLGWSERGKEWVNKILKKYKKKYPNIIYIGGDFYKEPFNIEYKDGKFHTNGVKIWLEEDNPVFVTVKKNESTYEKDKAWLDQLAEWMKADEGFDKFYEEKLRELKEKYGIKD